MSFFDDDWRSQLDSKYDELEYGRGESTVGGGDDGRLSSVTGANQFSDMLYESDYIDQLQEQNVVFDSIRFPPLVKKPLPRLINIKDLEIPRNPATIAYDMKRSSLRSNDSMAGLNFLEAMYSTLSEKTVDTRSSILEQGEYIYALPNPPEKDDAEYIKSTIMDNLLLLRDESVYLIKEMAVFHLDKINDMVHDESFSAKELIEERKSTLLEHASLLKSEIAESAIVVDHLIQFANSLINYPKHPICPIDGVFIDWSRMVKLQHQSYMSTRSANYVAHMQRLGLPVCDAMFSFLQSPQKCANVLSFEKYNFAIAEFREIFNFLKMQHKRTVARFKIQYDQSHSTDMTPRRLSPVRSQLSVLETIAELNIESCGIGTKECHIIGEVLPLMISLQILNLPGNRVNNQGVASLVTQLWDCDSRLRVLNLEDNELSSEGICMIAEALPRLQLLDELIVSRNNVGNVGVYHILKRLMNPFRTAYATLPPISSVGGPEDGVGVDGDGTRVVIAGGDGADDVSVSIVMGGDSSSVKSVSVAGGDPYGAKGGLLRTPFKAKKQMHPRTCFFGDYFAKPKPKKKARKKSKYSDKFIDSDGVEHDAEEHNPDNSSDEESVEDWINDEEDEFNMEIKSEYGEDNPPPSLAKVEKKMSIASAPLLSEAEVNGGGGEEWEHGEDSGVHGSARPTSVRVAVFQAEDGVEKLLVEKFKNVNVAAVDEKPIPRIIQLLVRHRLKLVGISMFLRASRRGLLLSSLGVRDCGVDKAILPVLGHVMHDNPNLAALDLSDNVKLLNRQESCKVMGEIILSSELATLKLNNCGITDKGLMELSRCANRSQELITLELSRNNIGPTGANWLASLNNKYTFDTLSMGGVFHRRAPFYKYGDEEHDANLDDTDDDPDNFPQDEDYWDYDYDSADAFEPYHDTDLYDGEDDDEDYYTEDDDEEEEEESKGPSSGRRYRDRDSGSEQDDDDDDAENDEDEDEDGGNEENEDEGGGGYIDEEDDGDDDQD